MKIQNTLIIIATALLLSTCKQEAYNPDVCFEQNVLPIFVSKCSMEGCHNSIDKEDGYDLSNYEGIIKGVKPGHPLLSEVYKVIRGNNPSMPLGGKLSAKEVSYIKIWIQMGANNTKNCVNCDTSSINYTNNVKPIFNNWCTGCHNANDASGGYDFSVYSGIAKSITDNRLLGAIQQLPGYSAMPTGNKLSDCDITIIQKWVTAGYPNN
jgi:hypothetical protein